MQLQHPLAVVAPTVSADVLAVLARSESEFTPPEVQRLVGDHSVDGVRRALMGLVAQGIVVSERSGNAVRYRLNRAHLAASPIVALAGLREELIGRLRKRIEGWRLAPEYSALFGSAARNDMRLDSDIDIFVVRSREVDEDDGRWRRQLDGLEAATSGWTGNDARVLEYGEGDVRAALRAGDRVLADIRAEGIRLTGPRGFLGGRLADATVGRLRSSDEGGASRAVRAATRLVEAAQAG